MKYEVWSFCLRTSRQLVQLGRCFWEPSCISHQKTSQQDRALLFPPSFLPQNDGCSFLLSDAPRRAAETIWQLWTQRANIRGSASPTNSLQIHPPLHLRLCIKNGFIHTKKAFNQKISFHHSFQEVMHLWEALWGFLWHRRYDVTFHVMWNQFLCYHRVRSDNSGAILCLSGPSLWHRELPDTEIWHAVRWFFTGIQKTFVIVENWNRLCKAWWCGALSSVFFDWFWHWWICI